MAPTAIQATPEGMSNLSRYASARHPATVEKGEKDPNDEGCFPEMCNAFDAALKKNDPAQLEAEYVRTFPLIR